MPRLIDADAMRQDWLENGQNEYIYDTNAVLDSIDAQPTIEAEPVRHGRWLDNEFYMFCSVCGMQWYYCDNETQDFKFCPHCGCKMDGDDDATN